MKNQPVPHHPPRGRKALFLLGFLVVLLALWQNPALAVPKTDVITLENGDVVTCEIKEMVRGKVRANTDHMGTVSIEWAKVTRVFSSYWFQFKLKSGDLVFGQMADSAKDRQLEVVFQEQTVILPMDDIVEITPVRYDLWDRFTMSASFGFNWDKGSNVSQSNLAAGLKYKGVIYSWGFNANFMVTDKGDGQISRRNQIDLSLGREISGRLQGSVDAGTSRNDELGLRKRVSSGANVGYFLARGNHLEFQTLLGATVNREWATENADPANNAEGRLGSTFSVFFYDSPKTDLTVQADAYPNFTVSDRWRFEGSVSGRQEIIKDLFIKLEYYESRDSKPPDGANAKDDRGIMLSIEWTK